MTGCVISDHFVNNAIWKAYPAGQPMALQIPLTGSLLLNFINRKIIELKSNFLIK
jgi:hypothetical protein